MKKDDFGDRMKNFEMAEAGRKLMPLLPVMIRLDGKSFHSFTRGLKRPYDERMSRAMIETTKYLVEETGACIGYTQSDEISLIIYSPDRKSQVFFDGRIQKLTSVIASLASVKFIRLIEELIPEKVHLLPVFDCRVWNVPNKTEAVNCILFREIDCLKNSISMAARSFYSHKEVDRKTGSEQQEMLFKKGINFNDYPVFFKRGTYVQKIKTSRKFTIDEISKLPKKHAARINSDLVVERSEVKSVEFPKLSSITNGVDVIFDGSEPILFTKEENT